MVRTQSRAFGVKSAPQKWTHRLTITRAKSSLLCVNAAASVTVEAHEIASGLLCRLEVARVPVCLHVLFGSSPDPSGAPPRRQKWQLGCLRARGYHRCTICARWDGAARLEASLRSIFKKRSSSCVEARNRGLRVLRSNCKFGKALRHYHWIGLD